MSLSNSEYPVLPYEIWVDILRFLDVETLWCSTRPVCRLFHHISNMQIKSALTAGSTCQLRHYISFKDELLHESLECPRDPNEYNSRILEQEGDSPLSPIILWTSPTPSSANPRNGPGIPTVNYESADGRKCYTMPVFGRQEMPSSSMSQERQFHCRRIGCEVSPLDSASDGHVCISGCWHVHYSKAEKRFSVTIPLAILTLIYLRLDMAGQQEKKQKEYSVEIKERRRIPGNRHGASVSVSPLTTPTSEDLDMVAAISVDGGDNNLMSATIAEWPEEEQELGFGLFE